MSAYAMVPSSTSWIQILPQQYAIAGNVPIQTMMPNLQSNIYNYTPIMGQAAEPMFVPNLTLFNVPTATVAALNSNVKNSYPTSAASEIYVPIVGTVSKESSYLDVQVDYSNLNLVKSKSDSENATPNMSETTIDWCQMEKIRIMKMCETTQWTGDTVADNIQPPRKMGAKCSSEFCKNSSARQCYEISEKSREEIFNFFWQKLTWTERQVYVCDLIQLSTTTRNGPTSECNMLSLKYFLRVNGIAKSVCKKMFINTIGIGENTLRSWMKQVPAEEKSADKTLKANNVRGGATRKANVAKPMECVFETKQQESPDYWIRDKVKRARERGEAYFGYSIKADDPKTGRRSYVRTLREQRSLGPPCTSSFCERSTKRQCSQFTNTIRQSIFDRFWKTLGWDERKSFIIESVDIMQPKRRTCLDVESSRRGVTCSYFLHINGQRHNICRQLFLSTLGIKEATVQYWLMQNTTEQAEGTVECRTGRDGVVPLYKSKRIRLPHPQKWARNLQNGIPINSNTSWMYQYVSKP